MDSRQTHGICTLGPGRFAENHRKRIENSSSATQEQSLLFVREVPRAQYRSGRAGEFPIMSSSSPSAFEMWTLLCSSILSQYDKEVSQHVRIASIVAVSHEAHIDA